MAATGVTNDEYLRFLKNGGTLVFEVDATDIDASENFTLNPEIASRLDTGFELRPSPIIDSPEERAELLTLGEPWVRVIVFTYASGGSIIYRKLPNGRFEATVTIPLFSDKV